MSAEKHHPGQSGGAESLPVEFHIEQFWTKYKNIVIFGLVLIVAVAILSGLYKNNLATQEKNSAIALNQAVDAGNLEAVASIVETYRGTQAAAQALLLISDMHFQRAEYERSRELYERFTREYPAHPLLAAAYFGAGSSLQAQGKIDAAIAAFAQLQKSIPGTIWTYHAQLSQAICHEQKGDPAGARRVYEELLSSQAPDTIKLQAQASLKRLG